MILELLSAAATQLVCPDCEAVGLSYDLTDEADGWQDAVLCEVCRKPIPPERLDAMPSARRCVSCQNQRESGVEAETPDFCPKCGSVLVVRVSRGAGVTRYKSFCTGDPPCRL